MTDEYVEHKAADGAVEELEIRIKREILGRRVDRYLSARFPYSRTLIQKLIRQGEITVNNEIVKPSYEVHKNDILRARFPVIEETVSQPEEIPLRIVYEDDQVLAINKQPDIVTHPAPGHSGGTLLNAVLHHCGPMEDQETDRPGIVHRLDKDTTGIMLFAKTEYARSQLQQGFEFRRIEKVYTAIAENDFEFDADLVDLPIGQSKTHREAMAIDLNHGRSAQTVYQAVERFGDYTLIKCMPRTGRTHQIRVHMAAIGHPLACDDLYGAKAIVYPSTLDPEITHEEGEEPLMERQALHATTISFQHPTTEKWIELEADFPEDFLTLLNALRKRGPVAAKKPRQKVRRRRK